MAIFLCKKHSSTCNHSPTPLKLAVLSQIFYLFCTIVFQTEWFYDHTVTQAMVPAQRQGQELATKAGLSFSARIWIVFSRSWNVTFMCSSFFSLSDVQTGFFCIIWFIFSCVQTIYGFLYVNPLYKRQITEYVIFMSYYCLAPQVTMWINVCPSSGLQHKLPNSLVDSKHQLSITLTARYTKQLELHSNTPNVSPVVYYLWKTEVF